MQEFPQIEAVPSHIIYLVLSGFLILFALFSELIRNRLHLSEPPLALFVGICCGLFAREELGPIAWRFDDRITQEITRIVVGLQVFTVGISLPAGYVKRHWKSLGVLIGPVMVAGWFISAAILYGVLGIQFSTALIIAATLTPTDPVLSASVLGEAKFSSRVPKRLRRVLSAESGCNDGSAFPFLYAAVLAVTQPTTAEAVKWWVIELVFWQCVLGILIGTLIGLIANRLLKFSEARGYVQESTLFVFYFLLAIFNIGVASVLSMDDFLVAFSAGAAFSWDGWFAKRTHRMKLPSIIDLVLNSTMFVYFGTLIPWTAFSNYGLTPWRLLGCTVLILVFRRIPALLLAKPFIPSIETYGEAFFAGHFGPIGVGAVFLAIEARAVLETGSSRPEPRPPKSGPHMEAIETVWPVVCFIVLGSIIVHGFSALVMSIIGHFVRHPKERAPLLGAETERLFGMARNEEDQRLEDDSSSEADDDENGR